MYKSYTGTRTGSNFPHVNKTPRPHQHHHRRQRQQQQRQTTSANIHLEWWTGPPDPPVPRGPRVKPPRQNTWDTTSSSAWPTPPEDSRKTNPRCHCWPEKKTFPNRPRRHPRVNHHHRRQQQQQQRQAKALHQGHRHNNNSSSSSLKSFLLNWLMNRLSLWHNLTGKRFNYTYLII